jgi:excisionase family DNA binding protein
LNEDATLIEQVTALVHRATARVAQGCSISPRLLDISDAARYLGMSDKAVRELIQCAELPYVQKIAGRSPYLLDIKDLDAWIIRNKITAGE